MDQFAGESYETIRDFVQKEQRRIWNTPASTLRRYSRFRGPTMRCRRYSAGRKVAGRPLSKLATLTKQHLRHLKKKTVFHATQELQALIYEEQNLEIVESACWVLWQWAAVEPTCATLLDEIYHKKPELLHVNEDAKTLVTSLFPFVGELGVEFYAMFAQHCTRVLPCAPGFWLETILTQADIDKWFWFGAMLSCAATLECRVSELDLYSIDSSVIAVCNTQKVSRSLVSITSPQEYKHFTGGFHVSYGSAQSFRIIAGVKKNTEHTCIAYPNKQKTDASLSATALTTLEPRFMCTWEGRPFCSNCAGSILGGETIEVDPPKRSRGGPTRTDVYEKGGLCTVGCVRADRTESDISTASIQGVESGLPGLNCWIGLVARLTGESWALHTGAPLSFAIPYLKKVEQKKQMLKLLEDLGHFRKRDSCCVTKNYEDFYPPISLPAEDMFDRIVAALAKLQPSLVMERAGKVGDFFLKHVALTDSETKSVPMISGFIKGAAQAMNDWNGTTWHESFRSMMENGWASIRGDSEDHVWWKCWYINHARIGSDDDLKNFRLGDTKQSEKLKVTTPILNVRRLDDRIQIETSRQQGAFVSMWLAISTSHPDLTGPASAMVALRYAVTRRTDDWLRLLENFVWKARYIAVRHHDKIFVWMNNHNTLGAFISLHDDVKALTLRLIRDAYIVEIDLDYEQMSGWKPLQYNEPTMVPHCDSLFDLHENANPWTCDKAVQKTLMSLCRKYGPIAGYCGPIYRIRCNTSFSGVPKDFSQTTSFDQLLANDDDREFGNYMLHDIRSVGFKFLLSLIGSVRGYTVVVSEGCCGVCLGTFELDTKEILRIL